MGSLSEEKDSPQNSGVNKDKLKRSGVNDEESFKCGFCGSKFISEADLINHMKIKHVRIAEEVLMDCDFCEEDFFLKSDINRHIKVIHKDIAECVLGKAFWINEDQAPYALECGNCNYTTSSEKCLNLHIEECQGLDYECEKCSFRCKTAGLLERHKKQNH